jgi:hypothetical protein
MLVIAATDYGPLAGVSAYAMTDKEPSRLGTERSQFIPRPSIAWLT